LSKYNFSTLHSIKLAIAKITLLVALQLFDLNTRKEICDKDIRVEENNAERRLPTPVSE
jgi:hypothetical protein